MNPLEVSSSNIWNYPQNKPSLITRDFYDLYGIPQLDSARILMSRGVFKWFAGRRKLLKLKESIKAELKLRYMSANEFKKNMESTNSKDFYMNKGAIKALEHVLKEIQAIGHAPRWDVQDNDRRSKELKWALDQGF